MDADEVEPHAGDGHGAVRVLPHRRLPAGRRQAGQPHPLPDGAGSASANCDTCHKGGFTPGRRPSSTPTSRSAPMRHLPHRRLPGGRGQAGTHPRHVTGNCESCHKSTSQPGPAKVDHSTFNAATNCASCHNGSTATGKPATHMPVGSTNCFSCHSVTGWTPTKWNHTQVTVTAPMRVLPHRRLPAGRRQAGQPHPVPVGRGSSNANCDACHKRATAAGPTAASTPTSRSAPVRHLPHRQLPPPTARRQAHKSTTSWATPSHAGVGTGTCENCHNGSAARSPWATSVTMNHTVVTTATCKSCHNGSYTVGRHPGRHGQAVEPHPRGASCSTVRRWTARPATPAPPAGAR
jgi:hypothetical protein